MNGTLTFTSLEDVIIRLSAAALLGLLVGLDRELKHKPIGFRPYMLVSLGAAAFTLVVMELSNQWLARGDFDVDPIRVVQGIVAGVGFLGAGAIIREERHLTGASTGAGIWVMGAIGMACGLGFYWHALITTAIAVIILVVFGAIHAWLKKEKP